MTEVVRNRVVSNTIANYVGAAVIVAVPILTLPTYLNQLGNVQWALVGFVATLQSLLTVLDAGMSQVLVREFAIRLTGTVRRAAPSAARLLASCERFYFLLGICAAAILLVLSYPISNYWLNVSADTQHLGRLAVIGAGVLCALQLLGVLYRGVLIAAQDQARLNLVLSAGSILRYGGGALAVALSPTIQTYLVWHILSFALEVLVRCRLAWRTVGGRPPSVTEAHSEIRGVLGGMGIWTFAAMIGAISAQMDKSILAAMRPIGELASYFVASQLAAGAIQLFYPVTTAMLPVLIQPARSARDLFLTHLKMAAVLLLICGFIAGFMLIFGWDTIAWWIGEQRAADVVPLLGILLSGVGCNALANIGYINWLAGDRRWRLLTANSAALLVVCALVPLLVSRIGVTGAAIAWSLGQFLTLIISLDWIGNTFKRRRTSPLRDKE